MSSVVQLPNKLERLAEAINQAHAQVLGTGRQMIEHAIACGEVLLEARDEVPSGQWLVWMKENVSVSIWTAHRYMRLATHKESVLESEVRHIEEAVRMLADKPRLGHGPRTFSTRDRQAIADHYHEFGMASTLEAWQCAKSTVWRLVSDRSPHKVDGRTSDLPKEVTDEAIERLAGWLVGRFGGFDYPERVTDAVRNDAESALIQAFSQPDESDLPEEEKEARAQELFEQGVVIENIASRLGKNYQWVRRHCDPDAAERDRDGSRDYKNRNRKELRAKDRERAAQKRYEESTGKPEAATIPTESPFSRMMFEAGR